MHPHHPTTICCSTRTDTSAEATKADAEVGAARTYSSVPPPVPPVPPPPPPPAPFHYPDPHQALGGRPNWRSGYHHTGVGVARPPFVSVPKVGADAPDLTPITSPVLISVPVRAQTYAVLANELSHKPPSLMLATPAMPPPPTPTLYTKLLPPSITPLY